MRILSLTSPMLDAGFDRKHPPLWEDVALCLAALRGQGGSMSLDLLSGDQLDKSLTLKKSLQVEKVDKYYLMTMYDSDSENETRTYWNAAGDYPTTRINYEEWSGGDLCREFDVIEGAVREFFETGDVSRNILN